MKPYLPSKDDWFELGTSLVSREANSVYTFYDLTDLTGPILPATAASGLHYYRDDAGRLLDTVYLIESFEVKRYEAADELIWENHRAGKTVYLLCMFDSASRPLTLRAALVDVHPRYSYFKPAPPREILAQLGKGRPDPSMYPHVCPFCGSKAFIGFNQVDCMEACR